MPEPIVRIRDIAYVRLRVPDLDAMERFLVDFGLVRSARTDTALYMRGVGPSHHVHICDRGDTPAFVGFGFLAASAADLDALAAVPGAARVEETGEPGGGRRVVLHDPWGTRIDLVHGIAPLAPLPAPPSPRFNFGERVERRGTVTRVAPGPAHVLRLGHGGINVPDPEEAFAWYHERFGILQSDTVAIGDMTLALFCRCDRGPEPTDHHTFLLARSLDGACGLNHASFELTGLDEIWLGHDHLAAQGHRHSWGIGRHVLGSQIFDYWRDPWGNIHEHYTDGDLLTADVPTGANGPEGVASQWGPPMPADFGRTVAP